MKCFTWKIEKARSVVKIRNAGPLIASGGQISGGLTFGLTIVFFKVLDIKVIWILIALSFIFVVSCFGLRADIISRVVTSEKRSLAFSIKIFAARTLGGSFPPFLAGLIAETQLQKAVAGWNDIESTETDLDKVYHEERFEALKVAFYIVPCSAFLSSILWYLASRTFVEDEDKLKATK